MLAVIGVLLLAAAAVVFSWAYTQTRRSDSNIWAQSDMLAQMFVLVWIGIVTVGVGIIGRAVANHATDPITTSHYVAIAAIIVASWFSLSLLRRRHRRLVAATSDVPRPTPEIRVVAANPASPHDPATQPPAQPPSRSPRAA